VDGGDWGIGCRFCGDFSAEGWIEIIVAGKGLIASKPAPTEKQKQSSSALHHSKQ
jgi:hypothetical protein